MGKKRNMKFTTRGWWPHILMAKQWSWRTKPTHKRHCEHHKVYLLGMLPQQQIKQWKKPGCLGYIGNYATQLCGDYNTIGRIPSKQPVSWKAGGFFFVAQMRFTGRVTNMLTTNRHLTSFWSPFPWPLQEFLHFLDVNGVPKEVGMRDDEQWNCGVKCRDFLVKQHTNVYLQRRKQL